MYSIPYTITKNLNLYDDGEKISNSQWRLVIICLDFDHLNDKFEALFWQLNYSGYFMRGCPILGLVFRVCSLDLKLIGYN